MNWLAQWECFCSYLQFSWLNTITGSTLLRIAPGYVDCSLLLTVLNNSGTVLLTQERIASFLLVKHSIPSSAINTVYFKKTKLLETSSNTWRCSEYFFSKYIYFISWFVRNWISPCDENKMLRTLKEAQNWIAWKFLLAYTSIEVAAKIQSLFFKTNSNLSVFIYGGEHKLYKVLCLDLIKKVKWW